MLTIAFTAQSVAMASQKLKVILFLGTVREGRLGIRVAKFMQMEMEKAGWDVTLFDPEEMQFPLLVKPLHFYKDVSQAPKLLRDCNEKIRAADAFLIVSAEYNHSIPPALSNMMDHFPGSSFNWRPAGIVCYSPGIYGGMRAAMQLRAFLGELGMVTVSNLFGIPKVHESIDENGTPLNSHMTSGAAKLLQQLEWFTRATKNHKDKVGTP